MSCFNQLLIITLSVISTAIVCENMLKYHKQSISEAYHLGAKEGLNLYIEVKDAIRHIMNNKLTPEDIESKFSGQSIQMKYFKAIYQLAYSSYCKIENIKSDEDCEPERLFSDFITPVPMTIFKEKNKN